MSGLQAHQSRAAAIPATHMAIVLTHSALPTLKSKTFYKPKALSQKPDLT